MVEMEIVNVISNFGFPIAICLWFMFRTEKSIKNNTDALNSIREVITLCKKK
jgi:hypothetical protein